MIRALLKHIVDYAGLFPPANLSMSQAVENYATYLGSGTSWMLGKFVVSAARLDEFESTAAKFFQKAGDTPVWHLSVLVSDNVKKDTARIVQFNNNHRRCAVIDAVELKATNPASPADGGTSGRINAQDIVNTINLIPKTLQPYFEIPITDDPEALIETIASVGACAKVRTGGITQEMFPAANDLARCIERCVKANVKFKATAGLHHPIRSCYRLTYETNSSTGMMYGFLNVFLAAAFLYKGMNVGDAAMVLEEASPSAFQFKQDFIEWRGHRLEPDDVVNMRNNVAVSFGSCSFEEPVSDLQSLHLL